VGRELESYECWAGLWRDNGRLLRELCVLWPFCGLKDPAQFGEESREMERIKMRSFMFIMLERLLILFSFFRHTCATDCDLSSAVNSVGGLQAHWNWGKEVVINLNSSWLPLQLSYPPNAWNLQMVLDGRNLCIKNSTLKISNSGFGPVLVGTMW
jgi:hypothetical protein